MAAPPASRTDVSRPEPAARIDGGDLDCGSGLLLLIRRAIDPLAPGKVLEIRSTEPSVEGDLPAWCRLTGNRLLATAAEGQARLYSVARGEHSAPRVAVPEAPRAPAPVAVRVEPLSAMGIGSWPRPAWLLRALHDHLEGRSSDAEFQATADDAVRLAVQSQLSAGVAVVTDGEQRRDSYASFVGSRLEGCQLIPLTDLLPLVGDPDSFREELASLDVPASEIRHPAVTGRIRRVRTIAGHELEFVRANWDRPVKVALPGPYLLVRTMWLECYSDRVYASREDLAADVVHVLAEELAALVAAGAALVQFDEPVLSEVVFAPPAVRRSFMCGALAEKREPERELDFARELLEEVVRGVPRERTAVHVCRGNWSPDESVALAGDYRPLLPYLGRAPVGTLFLELSTPRAGEIEVLTFSAGGPR